MNNQGYREVHIELSKRSHKLAWLRHFLPDLRLNKNCDPSNTPPNTLCYEYPAGREKEFEKAAHQRGVGYTWGIGGVTSIALFALGDYLYVVNTVPEFKIYDISDPTAPVNTDTLALPATPTALWLDESIAFVATSDGKIVRVNIDDPTAATIDAAETTETGLNISHLRVAGETAYLSGAAAGTVALYDVGQIPAKIIQDTEGTPDVVGSAVALQGRRLLFADSSGSPCLLRSYRIGGFRCYSVEAVMLHAIEMACELVEARHGYFKGDLFANSLTLHDELEISGLVFVDSADGSLQRLTIASGVLTVTAL